MIENASFSPAAVVMITAETRAELSEPVFARTLFSAGVPLNRYAECHRRRNRQAITKHGRVAMFAHKRQQLHRAPQ
jgi:hypothetical protein